VELRTELERLREVDDPRILLRELRRLLDRRPRDRTKGSGFDSDDTAWKVWKCLVEGDKQHPPLQEALLDPPARVLATSLVRLFPVVTALYEKVKARHQALDQLDLLVKLRDLLRDKLDARREYQRMFNHVFVDEFQDTDPLQAEIVLYLCEREPIARQWDQVELRDGALTLVGDPKQSIYRFRRADVAMYDRVRQVVARRDHLAVTLSANFRSVPPLIGWLNDRFERLLGTPPDGRPFDSDTGRVFHQPLGVPRVAEVLPLAVAVRTGGRRPARRPPGPARGQSAGRSPLAPVVAWIDLAPRHDPPDDRVSGARHVPARGGDRPLI
jgi:ATP-dependent helicase/nuclease subunit A